MPDRFASQMEGLHRNRWLIVVVFAIAMAWVEAALVFDLRTMVDRIQPHQPDPLPLIGNLGSVELVREMATLVMLLTVGFLAGQTARSRLGYTALAFGVWDIFYYIFLRVICGWRNMIVFSNSRPDMSGNWFSATTTPYVSFSR